jgi:hypothetical protein
MRTPFRLARPAWFGDPGTDLAPSCPVAKPLWRRMGWARAPALCCPDPAPTGVGPECRPLRRTQKRRPTLSRVSKPSNAKITAATPWTSRMDS